MRFWRSNRTGVVFASDFDYTTCPTFVTEARARDWVKFAVAWSVEEIIG